MSEQGTKSVLVVEDRPAELIQFQEWLEDGGYDVEVADDAEEGLAKFRQEFHQIVLLDIDLPGMASKPSGKLRRLNPALAL